MFGSVNNTSLIPLLPRLTVLSCISLISSPASNQPEGYSRSLFVCFSTGLVEKWFRCGKHQARRFIFRSERLALYQIISDRALMDRVQNRSETEQGKGIDHSWNRFSFPLKEQSKKHVTFEMFDQGHHQPEELHLLFFPPTTWR